MSAPPEILAYERAQIAKAKLVHSSKETRMPNFRAGDKLRVQVRIREGNNERLQAFEGVCIARHNAGLGSSFTVRKRSYGEGVERIFPLYSPNIAAIEIVQRGQVRRAKLYYLRERQGKKARIAEDMTRAREDRNLAALDKKKAMEAQVEAQVEAQKDAAATQEKDTQAGKDADKKTKK